MNKNINLVLNKIDKYYTDKINDHGVNPKGVDWKDKSSQIKRLEVLLKIILDDEKTIQINDIGCGYGVLYDIIKLKYKGRKIDYIGYDISKEMIKKAEEKYCIKNIFKNISNLNEVRKADYNIASGIFNVKMDIANDQWLSYSLETLEIMNQSSLKGFSFNILTSYSDIDKRKDYLYYADPCVFFDYCKNKFSKEVALLHNYKLYEFTILVNK